MKRLLLLFVLSFLAAYLLPAKLLAQGVSETGTLAGTVTDPSGAVVPNAKITAVNMGTGATRAATTDAKGAYVVPNLLPAFYSVTVEAAGFAKATRQAQIVAGTTLSLDVRLSVSAAPPTQVVVVGAGGVAVNTETPTISSVVNTTDLEELPTLTRNPYDLVSIGGMVSETDPSGRGVGVAINGLRAAGTNVLLDGAANNDEFTGSVGQAVPLDAVQEFTVLESNFGAQYGRASAGVVNVVTKSGTNAFHGTVYEFHRDSALDSNTFDNNAQGTGPDGKPVAPKPVFVRNQFGYSVGGPVKKNKVFFFSSIEWTRVRSAGTINELIPDPAFLSAANSNTQNFFSKLGSNLRPGLKTLAVLSRQDYISSGIGDPCVGAAEGGPCQSYPLTQPMFDEVSYNTPTDSGGGLPENAYSMVHRMDWNIGPGTHFYARYAFDNEIQFPGSVSTAPYAGYDTGTNIRNQNALLAYTHSFSPTFLSSTKFVFNRLKLVQGLGAVPVGPILYLTQTGGSVGGVPTAFPGYLDLTPGNGIPFGGPQNLFQVYEDETYTRGSHTFQFGGSYVLLQDNRSFGAYEEAVEILGKSRGQGLDNFLKGQLFQFQAAVDPQGKFPCHTTFSVVSGKVVASLVKTPQCSVITPVSPPNFSRSNRYNQLGAYFQDSWKMRPRLTLTLGLRWDYYGIQHNKNPLLDSNYYDGGGGSIFEQIRNGNVSIADQSRTGGLWAKDRKDFGPRLGFAWDVFGDGRTSLRGGYSIVYERNFGNVTFNVIQNPPAYAVVSLLNGVDVPSGTLPVTVQNAGPLAGSGVTKALPPVSLRNVDANIKSAYAHLWSLSFEHQFSPTVFVGVDYSGSKGKRLYSLENPNRPGSGIIYLGDQCADLDGDGKPDFGSAKACSFDRLRQDQYTNLNRRGGKAFSVYNALNLKLNLQNPRIFGWQSGLMAMVNYTYSHAIDNLSSTFSESFNAFNLGLLDPFNPTLERGSADFDIRHRIALSAVWNIPFARNTTGPWKRIFDGWAVAPIFTARTGSPFSIFDCTNAVQVCPRAFNLAGTSGLPRTGPDNQAVPGVPNLFTYIPFDNSDSSYVNPLVGFSDFGPFPANMTGRNTFRGPGAWFFDIGIYKTTSITERFKVQFRAEMFNAFNHSNLYAETFEADVEEGQMTAKRGVPPPALFFSDFGLQERRNVQLALKLIF